MHINVAVINKIQIHLKEIPNSRWHFVTIFSQLKDDTGLPVFFYIVIANA